MAAEFFIDTEEMSGGILYVHGWSKYGNIPEHFEEVVRVLEDMVNLGDITYREDFYNELKERLKI